MQGQRTHLKKVFFLAIIFLYINNTVFSENVWEENNWPELLPSFPLIDEYVKDKSYTDIDMLREEYIFILLFLEEAVAAVEKNIDNFFEPAVLFRYVPGCIDGKLLITTDETTVISFNGKTRALVADILPYVEFACYAVYMDLHNYLNDYWREKTGEILRQKYDSGNLANELSLSIQHRFECIMNYDFEEYKDFKP